MGWIALLPFAAFFLWPLLALFARVDRAALSETLGSPGFSRSLEATLVSSSAGAALSVVDCDLLRALLHAL